MGKINLDDYQLDAVERLKRGNILCGGVGSGKSRTALAYWYNHICGGEIGITDKLASMRAPIDLYIITTARKRDKLEWEGELMEFYMVPEKREGLTYIFETCMDDVGVQPYSITIDSWNNIKKYVDVSNAFFILFHESITTLLA